VPQLFIFLEEQTYWTSTGEILKAIESVWTSEAAGDLVEGGGITRSARAYAA
jgi:hypothetical protein